MLNKYANEIKDLLASKNIFYNDNKYCCIALLIDKLNDGKISDKSIGIYTDTNSELKDYNIIFVDRLDESIKDVSDRDNVLTAYFKSQLKYEVDFYFQSNENINICYINTKELSGYSNSLLFMRLVCSLVPKFLKGYYSSEKIIENKELLKNIIDSSDFYDYIKTICLVDFDALELNYKKKQIENCVKSANKRRLKNAERDIEDFRRRQRDLLRTYNELTDKINDSLNLMAGSREREKEEEEQVALLSEFMLENPCINVRNFDENKIIYDVITTISFFSMESFDAHVNNLNGNMFTNNDRYPAEKIHKLLIEIFKERKYKVSVAGTYILCIDRTSYIDCGVSSYSDICDTYPHAMPAPHQTMFHCVGDFPSIWNEALNDGNIIGAIQATIGLVQNLNWADTTVTSEFVHTLLERKCILDSNGDYYNGAELIEAMEMEV